MPDQCELSPLFWTHAVHGIKGVLRELAVHSVNLNLVCVIEFILLFRVLPFISRACTSVEPVSPSVTRFAIRVI